MVEGLDAGSVPVRPASRGSVDADGVQHRLELPYVLDGGLRPVLRQEHLALAVRVHDVDAGGITGHEDEVLLGGRAVPDLKARRPEVRQQAGSEVGTLRNLE